MNPFAINIKNSEKGERKKAVAWLRSQGYTVQKRKEDPNSCYLLSNSAWINYKPKYDFEYFSSKPPRGNVEILTLPRDWDKLKEYTRREEPIKTDTEGRITHSIIQQETHKFYEEYKSLKFPGTMSESFKLGMYRALELIGYKINDRCKHERAYPVLLDEYCPDCEEYID